MAVQNYTTVAAMKSFAGISDTNSDTELALVVAGVNDLLEGYIGAPVGDGGTAARTFDVDEPTKSLWLRHGIRPGTSPTVEYKTSTAGDFTAVASGNFVFRPHDWDRPTNWPAMELMLVDDSTPSRFYPGYDTVRITPDPDDGGWGWASVPAELQRIGDVLAVRMFQSRQSGDTLAIGSTEFGAAIVRFLPEPEYQTVLEKYRNVISPAWVAF